MSRKKLDKLTQEELQKTQVLNLKDVQDTVRYEKRTSKKPALILGLMGLLSITFGTTYSVLQSHPKVEEEKKVEARKKEEVKAPATSSLSCNHTEVAREDGTDTSLNLLYKFEDDKLVQLTKTFTVNISEGKENGKATLDGYVTGYQSFMNNIDGYTITVTPTETNIVAVVNIDYKKLDVTKLAPIQATHISTSVPYQLGTDKNTIQNEMTTKGYICQ